MRRAALVLGALGLLVTAPPLLLPAGAQTTVPTRLRLVSQTPWVGPGQEFVLGVRLDGAAPPPDAELAVSVHRRVSSRSEFVQTLDDRMRGTALTVTSALVTELTPDASGALIVRLPVQDPAQPPDDTRLRLRDDGVYPVRVELRRAGGGETVARFVTHLAYATPPAPDAPKLSAALVLPVHAAAALRPDGSRRLATPDSEALADLAEALEAHRDVPVSLRPTPETLQALAQGPDRERETLAALRRSATGRQVVDQTYVPTSTATFTVDGLAEEATAQLERGRRVVDETLGVRPDPRLTVADGPLTSAVLQQLRARGVERLIVPEPLLQAVDLPVTLTQPFELATRDVRRPAAVAADADLAAHFDDEEDPVLAGHHLLADLAVLAFDRPGRARGAVALPARSWRPTEAFLTTVLVGLRTSPIVAPVTVDDLLEDVPPATGARGTVLVRAPADIEDDSAPLPVARIRAERRRLQSFGAMLDAANLLDDTLDEQLLVAQSSELRTRQRAAYFDGVARRVDHELSLVRVPEARTITLTAREGEIPVTLLNETGYPVTLQVQVASDKLAFPGGAGRRVELARENTTERFSVEARGSGAFPLRVRLLSPDGALLIGETRFTVRSTVFSGVGLVLSVGALGVLFAWWGRHAVRGRRNRRLVPS